MDKKGVWMAFGVGVAAGAAVALLYAPESGARMRKRISSNIDDGMESLTDTANYLKEQADNLSKQAQAFVDRTRGQVQGVIDATTGAVTTATKSVQSLM